MIICLIENETTNVVSKEKMTLRNGNNTAEIKIPNCMAVLLSQLMMCSGASVVVFPNLFPNEDGEITTADNGWDKKAIIKIGKVGRYDTIGNDAEYSASYDLTSDAMGNTMHVIVKLSEDGNVAIESLAGRWTSDGEGPNYGFESSYEGTPYEYLACSSFICRSPLMTNDND